MNSLSPQSNIHNQLTGKKSNLIFSAIKIPFIEHTQWPQYNNMNTFIITIIIAHIHYSNSFMHKHNDLNTAVSLCMEVYSISKIPQHAIPEIWKDHYRPLYLLMTAYSGY